MNYFSRPIQQNNSGSSNSNVRKLFQLMNEQSTVNVYRSIYEFEHMLRTNIILSARAMYQSRVRFAVFERSQCNPKYWRLMRTGGFLLRQERKTV
ncbi:hypothetical protein [Gottfriedia sp. OAE603]|uniref:hypothetical protein n=1 Tax=Gottfriedia sp. OAE603 TaxID=2663872 RepID=UPI003483ABE2